MHENILEKGKSNQDCETVPDVYFSSFLKTKKKVTSTY